MSNINLILEERPADIGNFLVGRLLPFREKRMVGPFIFIDHAGPVNLDDHHNVDIGAHPHIGLSTLTYLFEGSVLHKDSLGNSMEINPGAVNWMTAGKGIVHSERTPEYLRNKDKTFHGLQIWVALPKELELMDPEFFHIDKAELPQWTTDDVSYKLIAGAAFGKTSPVPVYSKLFFIEIKSKTKRSINIGNDLYGESGLYILEGSIENEGNIYKPKQFLVSKENSLCEFVIGSDTTIYIFGGIPFAEGRHIYWNFVASDKELIERAKEKWLNQKFPKIAGEVSFVPLPEQNVHLRIK